MKSYHKDAIEYFSCYQAICIFQWLYLANEPPVAVGEPHTGKQFVALRTDYLVVPQPPLLYVFAATFVYWTVFYRYPIFKTYAEGNAIYKELSALKDLVREGATYAHLYNKPLGGFSVEGTSGNAVSTEIYTYICFL